MREKDLPEFKRRRGFPEVVKVPTGHERSLPAVFRVNVHVWTFYIIMTRIFG